MNADTAQTTPPPAADQQDERLTQHHGVVGAFTDFVSRARAGDVGLLPVIVGIIIIWAVFEIANTVFLSGANLSNLVLESVPVGVIALGIVCVLLVGEIDLSVGSMSGLSAAVLAVLFVNHGLPAWIAVIAALAAGALAGYLYAQLYNRFGVPSFVATLAGLLSFLGLQLYTLGNQSINLPFDSFLVTFAQTRFLPPWLSYVVSVAAAGGLFATGYSEARRRRAAGLSGKSMSLLVSRSVLLLVIALIFCWYLNRGRGVGWMFVFFVALALILNLALTRTRWGRSVFAVGGNEEAARRAGINVRGIYTSVFILCSTFAALGGILAAARLSSANTSSGSGDVNLDAIAAAVIGGTSLFGGRGSAWAAVLGVIVIQSISSGLTLINLSSSIRFIVTGIVLVIAVGIDSVARRSRSSHGRA